jgi:hypothetical protein
MAGPFKMKGFSGFGNSPVKHIKTQGHKHNEDGTISWVLWKAGHKKKYKEAWDAKDQENKDKYGSFENFVKAAEKWKKEQKSKKEGMTKTVGEVKSKETEE